MYEPRECMSCHMVRIPDVRVVSKGKKRWDISTCRICKQQDIEPHTTAKLWDGLKFVDDKDSFFEED